jgi:hypothetical protein
MSKIGQRGTWETIGGPATPPHHQGRGPALATPTYGEGAPLASHLSLPPQLFLSPKNNDTAAQTRVLAALHLDFLISLLSPSLLLRFGAFVLRYVTPPIVQVEFCLVEYFLSILALYVIGEMSLHACSIAKKCYFDAC